MSWTDRLRLALLPRLGRPAVRLLGRTLTLAEVNRVVVEPLWAAQAPVIYACWHGRILMIPYFYRKGHHPYVLASLHRDGELVSRFVRGFGFRVVRGSSTRGGASAIRELVRLLRSGAEVAIIPDGPRGPRYVVQPGITLLAKLSGAPIIPLAVSASRRTLLRSWDEFLIPHPFARVVVIFGEPIRVPADARREVLEERRKALEASLRQLTWQADVSFGPARVSPV